jgi:hypothetical protein
VIGVRDVSRPKKLAFSTLRSAFRQGKGVAALKNFRDLKVWEKAHSFTLDSYRFTNAFPRRELFGLTSQIRRAAVSIAANIAEGVESAGTENFSEV